MYADALALLAVMVGTNFGRFGLIWPTYPLSHYAVGFCLATGIHVVVAYFAGLYEPEQRLGQQAWLPRVASATFVAILFDASAALLTGRYLMPRFNLLILLLAGSVALATNRRLFRLWQIRRVGRPRVLLVGQPADVKLASSHLHETDRRAVVAGECDDLACVQRDAAEHGATDVLLLSSSSLEEVHPGPLASLERAGVGVYQRVGAKETLLGLRNVREVAGLPFVALHTHSFPPYQAQLKRLSELVGVLVTTPLWLPVLGFVALYVRVVAGPPVLFRQLRVGKLGRPFLMVKFRTMVPDAEEGLGPVLARKGDPRVLRGCQWLRDTRLDELPQLWNVLRGEMAVVGPRPERPERSDEFGQRIAGYDRRYEVPPGMTGLAQINGYYHTDAEYKLGHDLYYLVNWSPILDLQILAKTLWVVLRCRV